MTRLLVISHTPHYLRDGEIVAWGPTVRELDCLARAFGFLTHLAPLHSGEAPASAIPYHSGRVRFRSVRPAGGESLWGKLDALVAVPRYAWAVIYATREADVVQVRCPCNVGLVACIVASFCRGKPRWAKYAGNWRPSLPEPLSYKLQRFWLESGWFGGPVTVNGRWPGQPPHVHSFLNPCLTERELENARAATAAKRLSRPVRLVFVGKVVEHKGAVRVIEIAAGLAKRGIEVTLDIAGHGSAAERAISTARESGIAGIVRFHGWQPPEALGRLYSEAHFVLLPSSSEGWPKVLSEGMAYRAVPVASAVSSIGQVLRDTGGGIALRTLDTNLYVEAIERLVRSPGEWEALAARSQAAAASFTYEVYVDKILHLMAHTYPERGIATARHA